MPEFSRLAVARVMIASVAIAAVLGATSSDLQLRLLVATFISFLCLFALLALDGIQEPAPAEAGAAPPKSSSPERDPGGPGQLPHEGAATLAAPNLGAAGTVPPAPETKHA